MMGGGTRLQAEWKGQRVQNSEIGSDAAEPTSMGVRSQAEPELLYKNAY